jgi:hypothetical protein
VEGSSRSWDGGYQGPGVYVHYKGGHYVVLGLALREESKEAGEWLTEVVYSPMTKGSLLEERDETMWTRLLTDFNAEVRVESEQGVNSDTFVPRFKLLYYFEAGRGTRPGPGS